MTKKILLVELKRRISARIDYYRPFSAKVEKFGVSYEHYVGRIEGLQEVLAMLEDYD